MAVDMFIKFAGGAAGSADGESVDPDHRKWIDVLAYSWGLSNSGTTQKSGSAGAGKASFQDLSFTAYVDSSHPKLLAACASGKHFDTASLTVRKAGATPLEYIKYVLTEVLVTSVATGGSGGEDRLTQNVSLDFAKIHFEYTPSQDAKGTGGTPIPFDWDLTGKSNG